LATVKIFCQIIKAIYLIVGYASSSPESLRNALVAVACIAPHA